ncbi:MAG TPA: hypothetical protein VHF88_00870 [Thermoleophilaceae bacterium]|nr:hypothetical protein [Thermoleophilaceae bacterium]
MAAAAGAVAIALGALFAGTAGAQAAADLSKLDVAGPKTVKQGASKTYRVTVVNVGDAAAEGIEVVASGGGKGRTSVSDTLAPAASTVVRVKVKITGKAGKTVTVTFKATTSAGTTASGKIRVTVPKKKTKKRGPAGAPQIPLYPAPQLPSVGGGS